MPPDLTPEQWWCLRFIGDQVYWNSKPFTGIPHDHYSVLERMGLIEVNLKSRKYETTAAGRRLLTPNVVRVVTRRRHR
jgi:hypothetical protein